MAQGTSPFISDIKEIRRRAREHIEQGAVTDAYKADRPTVIKLLNEALAEMGARSLRRGRSATRQP